MADRDDIRIEVREVDALLAPRWWQLRYRLGLWRLRWRYRRANAAVARAAARRMEDAFLYGDDRMGPP